MTFEEMLKDTDGMPMEQRYRWVCAHMGHLPRDQMYEQITSPACNEFCRLYATWFARHTYAPRI